MGVSLFASLVGYLFLYSTTKSECVSWFGTNPYFTKSEAVLQTTSGVAAGGLSAGFVSAIPALLWLG